MRINKDVMEDIARHALETYPYECCGIVTGDRNKQTIHLCKNVQNRLHVEDPERHPRDARTAYSVDRDEADRIYSEAKHRGEEIIAFYHSHIDCDAYFSETDVEAQTVFGEPEFPGALHIVVSVIDKKVHAVKYFKWDGDRKEFISLPFS
jgi:proteasome lid subunit RPN8/RPN11